MDKFLPRKDYLEVAERLPLGQSKRVNHHCGPGRTLKINHEKQGYSAYCFRCHLKSFTRKERRSLSDFDIVQQKTVTKEVLDGSLTLPEDFTLDIPDDYAVWLWKYGFDRELSKELGFGYSPKWGRIVLPVYDGSGLRYIQARATEFPVQQPKYLDLGNKDGVLATFGDISERVILTEDILSAAKVGLVSGAASIMGTSMSIKQAMKLSHCSEIVWWLDGDRAGIRGRNEYKSHFDLLDIKQSFIQTPKDPKKYSRRKITEFINNRGALV